jgi:hypothetical protein
MIQRKFRSNGDVDAAQRLVFASRGIDRARELAAQHAGLAVQAVRSFATLMADIQFLQPRAQLAQRVSLAAQVMRFLAYPPCDCACTALCMHPSTTFAHALKAV